MTRFFLVFLCLMSLFAQTQSSYADTDTDTDSIEIVQPLIDEIPPMISGKPQVEKFPISRFMAFDEPIELNNMKSYYTIYFPISDRISIKTIRLRLDAINSNSLVKSRSQLRISLNDQTIAQIKLDPVNHHTVADIELPTEQLISGYNRLTFSAAQHYTEEYCELWNSPELWTEISTTKTLLTFVSTKNNVTPKLADLNELINDQMTSPKLHMLFLSDQLSPQQVKWGSLAVQGVSQRISYQTLDLTHSLIEPISSSDEEESFYFDQSNIHSDAFLIGTAGQLGAYLSMEMLTQITGPYLAIFRQKSHPENYLMVASGTTESEVSEALIAFSMVNFPLPSSQQTVLRHIRKPTLRHYQSPNTIVPDTTYSFRQLGYKTSSIRGMSSDRLVLNVKMPPDLRADDQATVDIRLHFAHGSGLREDSSVLVFLNDNELHKSIPMTAKQGEEFQDYLASIPLRSFKPGQNTLILIPDMVPLVSGECLLIHENNLVATIFDDSTITFPNANHYTTLPDLKLLADTGFPYTRHPAGKETTVYLLNNNIDTIMSSWLIMGKLAQTNGISLYQAKYTFEPTEDDVDLLVVGKLSGKNDKLFAEAPVQPGELLTLPYTIQMVPSNTANRDGSLLTQASNWLFDGDQKSNGVTQLSPQKVFLSLTGGLGNNFLNMSWQNPYHDDRLITAFVYEQSNSLLKGIKSLTKPDRWSQIDGDRVIWDSKEDYLISDNTGASFSVGSASINTQFLHSITTRPPWRWALALLLIIALVAAVTNWLLGIYSRKHHQGNVKNAPS